MSDDNGQQLFQLNSTISLDVYTYFSANLIKDDISLYIAIDTLHPLVIALGYLKPGPVFSYKLRYIVGFWLVEMAISTNQ